MTTVLCTLYNSLYLDKGLVLYDSLCECAKDFKLYVLCMDDKCFEVLTDLKQDNHIPIKLSDFEKGNDKLLKAKGNRSFVEYFWTCTPSLILYIFEKFNEQICSYIDADMYFYHDPQALVDEILMAGKSVMMVPHRFTGRNQYLAATVGEYCVEFNTFKGSKEGVEVLNDWYQKCLGLCSEIGDGVHWGDQKYMDEWPELFSESIHICEHPGAGVAPWNVELYDSYDKEDNTVFFKPKTSRISIVFYHFQSITYLNRYEISTGILNNLNADYKMIESLYNSYLEKIDVKKRILEENYGINTLIKSHPAVKQRWWKRILKSFSCILYLKKTIMKSENFFVISIA